MTLRPHLATVPPPAERDDDAPGRPDPPAAFDVGEVQGDLFLVQIQLPTGRSAIVGLPVGCKPGEALYVTSKLNEIAGAAWKAADPAAAARSRLIVPR